MIPNFDILKKLSLENKNINLYSSQTNLVDVKVDGGVRDGWGTITFAVDTKNLQKMVNHEGVIFWLFSFDINEFFEAKKELEKEENNG